VQHDPELISARRQLFQKMSAQHPVHGPDFSSLASSISDLPENLVLQGSGIVGEMGDYTQTCSTRFRPSVACQRPDYSSQTQTRQYSSMGTNLGLRARQTLVPAQRPERSRAASQSSPESYRQIFIVQSSLSRAAACLAA
jgi:hypothetical protein